MDSPTNNHPNNEPEALAFEARVQATQRRLGAELQSSYDFIVCGSGSSGSVVARRLAESDDVPVRCSRREAPTIGQVSETLGNGSPMSERNWIGDFRPRPIGC